MKFLNESFPSLFIGNDREWLANCLMVFSCPPIILNVFALWFFSVGKKVKCEKDCLLASTAAAGTFILLGIAFKFIAGKLVNFGITDVTQLPFKIFHGLDVISSGLGQHVCPLAMLVLAYHRYKKVTDSVFWRSKVTPRMTNWLVWISYFIINFPFLAIVVIGSKLKEKGPDNFKSTRSLVIFVLFVQTFSMLVAVPLTLFMYFKICKKLWRKTPGGQISGNNQTEMKKETKFLVTLSVGFACYAILEWIKLLLLIKAMLVASDLLEFINQFAEDSTTLFVLYGLITAYTYVHPLAYIYFYAEFRHLLISVSTCFLRRNVQTA